MKTITVLVPCYNEEESLLVFYETVKEVMSALPHEYDIIFIDDGSKDKTLEICIIILLQNYYQ